MFDLVILGSGSAAFAAAIKAADHGAKTAMIERSTIGGTCVNVGCVPSKNLLRAGEIGYYDSHREFPGIRPGPTTLEFNRIIEQKNQIVRGLRKEKYADVLRSLPSTKLFRGNAKFVSRTRVKVDGINVDGKKFVVATGSSPRIPSTCLDGCSWGSSPRPRVRPDVRPHGNQSDPPPKERQDNS